MKAVVFTAVWLMQVKLLTEFTLETFQYSNREESVLFIRSLLDRYIRQLSLVVRVFIKYRLFSLCNGVKQGGTL